MRNWSRVKHFKREEWREDPDRILWSTVLLMDEMRDAAGVPIIIHIAYAVHGHENNSSHYGRLASGVDFHFHGWSLLDQYLFAERFPWRGIGVYPYWQNPGLHVDLRVKGREYPNCGYRWWRAADGLYYPFNRELFKTLLLLPSKPSS